ncbi:MAG: helix-hairpin-helix domain-containing protein [Marinoscillum sp.]
MLRIIIQWMKDTLGFSKSEANGTLVLILVIVLLMVLPQIYFLQMSPENPFEADQEKMGQYVEQLKAAIILKEEKHEKEKPKVAPKSFSFDPNQVSKEDLIALGFSGRTAHSLINYRSSGGKFTIKRDLKKIYGISTDRVDELWDQIELPETINISKISDRIDSPVEEIIKIELNSAEATDLQKVKGIGPVLSQRIIGFRNKLGGFHNTSQLYEVYGLDSAVVEELIGNSELNMSLKKINLNTDSLKHLYQHPYIDYNLAKAILNFKNQRGRLDSIGQIKEIKILDEGLYQKLYPYLSINP